MPGASERSLSRLRFDLHDGPQQDVIILAEDLRLFRDQLASVIDNAVSRDRVLGRIDDLLARLVALDGDLRRISSSLESPFLHHEPLPDAIDELAGAFAARTAIEPQVTLHGELSRLSDSQQITLLALIREALANIREHSDAERVTISVSAGGNGVEATVTDDGRGFDPEETLVVAAREGHLGLVGMHERVRMLGGQTRIDSRPGGPTVISVRLPAWPRAQPASN
jgi:signal transduction histidine kinase